MNYFDKNKLLTAAVIVLLITNIGILSLLWFDRSPVNSFEKNSHGKRPPGERMPPQDGIPRPDRMPPGDGPKDFIIRELNLNEKQIEEFGNLVKEHQTEMRELKDKIRNEKEELWDSMSGKATDKNSVERITSEIGNNQKQIELITLRHFQKVRDLCNDDQKKKFDEIIKDVLRMMGPGTPPPFPNKN
ncbi:MAG TPA: Spy/CpxP family protein refolding chaperone [Ignavibacteria bacterium]|nr:Spy/CpxP family protein refolding chaperone [Ignavibacteria bacterium]